MAPASSTCIVNLIYWTTNASPKPWASLASHTVDQDSLFHTATLEYMQVDVQMYGREVRVSLVYSLNAFPYWFSKKKRNVSLMQLAFELALKKLKLVKSNHQYNSCKQTLNKLDGSI